MDMMRTPFFSMGANAHHERDVGAIDVGIQKPNFTAQARERDGEVHGDGRFSDAPFTRSDGDQIPDAGDRKLRLLGLRGMWTH
jgi:hypothetical protein